MYKRRVLSRLYIGILISRFREACGGLHTTFHKLHDANGISSSNLSVRLCQAMSIVEFLCAIRSGEMRR